MRSFFTILSAVLLASTSLAQRTITSTLPYVDGNTVIVVISTDLAGDLTTDTINPQFTGGTATTSTTPLTTAIAATTTRRATKTTTAANNGAPTTTTGQRVVGVDTTAAPMQTTTYWYDTGLGYWTVATWSASVTGAPAVATVVVPQGTIQDYNSYQQVVNSAVLSSAQNAAVTGGTSGALKVQDVHAGWAAVAVGVIGAGIGAMML